jgi:hypothetical protein
MRLRAGRVVLAAGLLANAAILGHPLALAIAQAVIAVVVLADRGGAARLAVAALLLVPAPVAEARRWLGHAPLSCRCNLSSGRPGLGPAATAAADVGLIGLAVWLARQGVARPTGAATGS